MSRERAQRGRGNRDLEGGIECEVIEANKLLMQSLNTGVGHHGVVGGVQSVTPCCQAGAARHGKRVQMIVMRSPNGSYCSSGISIVTNTSKGILNMTVTRICSPCKAEKLLPEEHNGRRRRNMKTCDEWDVFCRQCVNDGVNAHLKLLVPASNFEISVGVTRRPGV